METQAQRDPRVGVESRSRYVIASALRTLELLKSFIIRPHRFTMSELGEITGLEKNQLYRSVKTLEEAGFLETGADGRMFLTGLVHVLGNISERPESTSLPVLAAPLMDELVALTGESVNLFVRRGLSAVCVDRRDSPHLVRLASVLGVVVPLHAGAVPKAMLAFLPESDQERVLAQLPELPAYTSSTVLDAELLREELQEIRRRGYAISDGDYDDSARGVAAPVFSPSSDVVAGVSVGGPSFRVPLEALEDLGRLVISRAAELTARLAHVG